MKTFLASIVTFVKKVFHIIGLVLGFPAKVVEAAVWEIKQVVIKVHNFLKDIGIDVEKIFVRKVFQGQEIPTGYGFAYFDYRTAALYCVPLGFNLMVSGAIALYFGTIHGFRSRVESHTYKTAAIIGQGNGFAVGYANGFADGKNGAPNQISDPDGYAKYQQEQKTNALKVILAKQQAAAAAAPAATTDASGTGK